MGLHNSTTDVEKPWNMDQVRHQYYLVHHNQLPSRSGGLTIAPTQHLEIWMYVEMYGMFEQNQVLWNIHHIKSDSRESALVSLVWFLVWRLVRLEEEQTSPSMFQVCSHSSLHSQPWTEQEGSEESDVLRCKPVASQRFRVNEDAGDWKLAEWRKVSGGWGSRSCWPCLSYHETLEN